MDRSELLERYEATGDEEVYVEARRLFEAALAEGTDDPQVLHEYGYLQECHGRNAIRAATALYRQAIELAPDWAKPRFQLMFGSAALFEPDEAVATYSQRLASAPGDIREYRYLASAYLNARAFGDAEMVIRRGLEVARDDPILTGQLGEVCAATGRPDEAIEHWRRAYPLDPEALDSRYGAAFLLEKEGRLAEATDEWRFIISWNEERGDALHAEWPKRELARLESILERGS
jgi:tetratricopeptide (TPR) repeat protein